MHTYVWLNCGLCWQKCWHFFFYNFVIKVNIIILLRFKLNLNCKKNIKWNLMFYMLFLFHKTENFTKHEHQTLLKKSTPSNLTSTDKNSKHQHCNVQNKWMRNVFHLLLLMGFAENSIFVTPKKKMKEILKLQAKYTEGWKTGKTRRNWRNAKRICWKCRKNGMNGWRMKRLTFRPSAIVTFSRARDFDNYISYGPSVCINFNFLMVFFWLLDKLQHYAEITHKKKCYQKRN